MTNVEEYTDEDGRNVEHATEYWGLAVESRRPEGESEWTAEIRLIWPPHEAAASISTPVWEADRSFSTVDDAVEEACEVMRDRLTWLFSESGEHLAAPADA